MKKKDRVPYAEAVKRVEQTKRVNEGNVRGEIVTGITWTQTRTFQGEGGKGVGGKEGLCYLYCRSN